MSSMINKLDLIAALRLRYDHYSAPTIFEAALAAAGLRDQESFDASEVKLWRAALAKIGDRLESVEERLDSLSGGPDAKVEPSTPPKAADAKAEPVTHTKPTDAKPEPVTPPKAADAKAEPVTPAKAAESKAEPATHAKPADAKAEPATKDTTPAASKPGEETSTPVKLVGIDVGAGEQVLVCGSFVDWNVERAVEMKRSGDAWLATLPVAPGTKIAFKFLRHAADGTVIWEGGDDRKLAGSRIEATWQPEDVD